MIKFQKVFAVFIKTSNFESFLNNILLAPKLNVIHMFFQPMESTTRIHTPIFFLFRRLLNFYTYDLKHVQKGFIQNVIHIDPKRVKKL